MASPTLVYLCAKLAHDPNAGVREIGQRCMREFDEFAGMRYARLTAQDEARLADAAQAAREGHDVARAQMLEDGAEMIRQARSPRAADAAAAPPAVLPSRRRRGAR